MRAAAGREDCMEYGSDCGCPALASDICWSQGDDADELETEEGRGLSSRGVVEELACASMDVLTVGRPLGDHDRLDMSEKPLAELMGGSMVSRTGIQAYGRGRAGRGAGVDDVQCSTEEGMRGYNLDRVAPGQGGSS